MLPRAQRIPSAAFSEAFREGRILRHPLLQLRVHRRLITPVSPAKSQNTPDLADGDAHIAATLTTTADSSIGIASNKRTSSARSPVTRATFVVAKKLGKATLRNNIRRRLSECYSHNAEREQIFAKGNLAHCDLIFFATPATQAASLTELDEAITQLLRRAQGSGKPTGSPYKERIAGERRFVGSKPPGPERKLGT